MFIELPNYLDMFSIKRMLHQIKLTPQFLYGRLNFVKISNKIKALLEPSFEPNRKLSFASVTVGFTLDTRH